MLQSKPETREVPFPIQVVDSLACRVASLLGRWVSTLEELLTNKGGHLQSENLTFGVPFSVLLRALSRGVSAKGQDLWLPAGPQLKQGLRFLHHHLHRPQCALTLPAVAVRAEVSRERSSGAPAQLRQRPAAGSSRSSRRCARSARQSAAADTLARSVRVAGLSVARSQYDRVHWTLLQSRTGNWFQIFSGWKFESSARYISYGSCR